MLSYSDSYPPTLRNTSRNMMKYVVDIYMECTQNVSRCAAQTRLLSRWAAQAVVPILTQMQPYVKGVKGSKAAGLYMQSLSDMIVYSSNILITKRNTSEYV